MRIDVREVQWTACLCARILSVSSCVRFVDLLDRKSNFSVEANILKERGNSGASKKSTAISNISRDENTQHDKNSIGHDFGISHPRSHS